MLWGGNIYLVAAFYGSEGWVTPGGYSRSDLYFADGTDNGERPGRLGLIPSEGFNVIAIRSWLAFGSFSPRRMYGTSFFLSFILLCGRISYCMITLRDRISGVGMEVFSTGTRERGR